MFVLFFGGFYVLRRFSLKKQVIFHPPIMVDIFQGTNGMKSAHSPLIGQIALMKDRQRMPNAKDLDFI